MGKRKKALINKLDSIAAKMVKRRACYRCETCLKAFSEGSHEWLDCSHYHGRTALSVRWEPDNMIAQCRECHMKFHSHRGSFDGFMMQRLGAARFIRLGNQRNSISKLTEYDLQFMLDSFREQSKTQQIGEGFEAPAVILSAG